MDKYEDSIRIMRDAYATYKYAIKTGLEDGRKQGLEEGMAFFQMYSYSLKQISNVQSLSRILPLFFQREVAPFEGIERKIAQRLNTYVVGFGTDNVERKQKRENLINYVAPQDLRSFGLIPEIIGRLPILTNLEPLDRNALRRILSEPKNAIIKQYQKLFEMDGVKLVFEKDALDLIVDKSIEYKLGARGLRSLTETIVVDAMYESPSSKKKEFVVTREYALEKLNKANLDLLV